MKNILIGFLVGVAAVTAIAAASERYAGGFSLRRGVVKMADGRQVTPIYAQDIRWGVCPICGETRWPVMAVRGSAFMPLGFRDAMQHFGVTIVYVCPLRHVTTELSNDDRGAER